VDGNYVDAYPKITADNWDGGVFFADEGRDKELIIPKLTEAESRARAPFDAPVLATEPAVVAYERVLADAGASLPRRDAVDERIIASVRRGKPAFGDGIIDSPADVGGWPEYRLAPPHVDGDRDGMPDAWERSHGLDPGNPSDAASDADRDGYTAVEEYLNGTDPTAFVDYTKPENNRNTLRLAPSTPELRK
jgi:hypothetical protein